MMSRLNAVFYALVYSLIVGRIFSQIPCDDQYGAHCPEASGLEVGDCLKKLDADVLGASCSAYIAIHDACMDDIKQYCNGNAYTGDLLPCLTEWTKPADLTEGCLAALPKKEVQEKKKLSAEEKKKADARRKIRNKAAKMARKSEL